MRSLRSRVIIGVALVAIVPVSIVSWVLSQRVQEAVHTQAGDRLEGVLGLLQAQLISEGARVRERIDGLSADPRLARLYFLPPSGSETLASYLREQRGRLGLDFLVVADTSGRVVADGPAAAAVATREPPEVDWLLTADHRGSDGLSIESLATGSPLALSSRSPVRFGSERVALVRGGVFLDAALLQNLKQTSGVDLVLRDAAGSTVATTLNPDLEPFVPLMEDPQAAGLKGHSHLVGRIAVPGGAAGDVRIVGLVSTADVDRTVAALRTSALLFGFVGLTIAVLLGVWWSRQVSRPVERLAAFSERIALGKWDEPLKVQSVRELDTLVRALERMRHDLHDYRARLVSSERQAAWGQMARMVAHEVKNPLTPIAVSIADLKRSHEQNRPDFSEILTQAARTIDEEITSLKRLLQEFSDFGRFPRPRMERCLSSELLADLRTLYGHDVAEGRLILENAETFTFDADRGQIRQALVNLIKNGLEAVGSNGRVRVGMQSTEGGIVFEVSDTGPGLDEGQLDQLFVPDFTTKSGGSGLGLTIVERIASDHGGTITVSSAHGSGTTFVLHLPGRREA